MKIYRKEKGIPEPEEKPEDIPARNDFSSAPAAGGKPAE